MNTFKSGEKIICVERSATARLTVGKEYAVEWVREDINFPTIINDQGRRTQYSDRWFVRREDVAA